MKASQLWPSKYVVAADLNGKDVTLTIKQLKLEEMGVPGQKEEKPVLYFERATKGLVLNRTNGMIIAALYGDEVEGWQGKRVTLYPTTVRAFGKTNDVIRVREQVPPPPAEKTTAAATQQPAPVQPQQGPQDEVDFANATPDGVAMLDDPEDVLDQDGGEDEAAATPDNPFYDPPAASPTGAGVPAGGTGGYEDGTPFFSQALATLQQPELDLIGWATSLHRRSSAGPCSVAEFKEVGKIVKELTGVKNPNEVLSILTQSYISDNNRLGAELAKDLIHYLPKTIPLADGSVTANREHLAKMAEAIINITTPQSQPEPA